MSKQLKTLANPLPRGDGVSITKLEIDYVYFHTTSMQVFYSQGVSVTVAYNAPLLKALKDIEDSASVAIDKPAVP